jgi:uncharacterized protein YprB with RNaseH-like and TPR domain
MRPTKENAAILKEYVDLVLDTGKFPTRTEIEKKITSERQIRKHFDNITNLKDLAIKVTPEIQEMIQEREIKSEAKILLFDIETAPILGYVWGLWDNNLGLNQVNSDWYVLSWSAKWLGDSPKKIMYMDQRHAKNIENDKPLLEGIWKLLDEADVVITQNGKKFDHKKLNARFILNKMQPPSSYKHIDTLVLAKRHFGFTSNKLEYMTDKLCTKYKKLKHGKFSGFEMWKQCLARNMAAWKEMEKYNKYDVLSLEELYTKLIPWDNDINLDIFRNTDETKCSCGSTEFSLNGFFYTSTGKFQKHRCVSCGSETRDRQNLFSLDKKKVLRMGTKR